MPRDRSLFPRLLEACQKASRWQPALKLLDDLCASSAAADLRAAYRAAVVTCDRGGEPLRAMWLLEPRLPRGMLEKQHESNPHLKRNSEKLTAS